MVRVRVRVRVRVYFGCDVSMWSSTNFRLQSAYFHPPPPRFQNHDQRHFTRNRQGWWHWPLPLLHFGISFCTLNAAISAESGFFELCYLPLFTLTNRRWLFLLSNSADFHRFHCSHMFALILHGVLGFLIILIFIEWG